MVVAFCGHSDYKESSRDGSRVMEILEEYVGDSECELFLGEYGNFDSFAYNCAYRFKQLHPGTKLVFISPYVLPKKQCTHEFDITIYPGLENVPPKFAIAHRNRWIVDRADLIIAYVSRSFGGAYAMYSYAARRKKDIRNIAF